MSCAGEQLQGFVDPLTVVSEGEGYFPGRERACGLVEVFVDLRG